MRSLFRTRKDLQDELDAQLARVAVMHRALTYLAWYPPPDAGGTARIAAKYLLEASAAYEETVRSQ